ncbi:MAG TPA: hypothetical protein VLV48_06980, partial [Thermoanaerobaculia bacterium]|nr:hypothetical protein [Thermoanaerobaculia bacterium]
SANAECKMQNEKSKKGIALPRKARVSREVSFFGFYILHFAFCILHFAEREALSVQRSMARR